jgi:hypothetical protein
MGMEVMLIAMPGSYWRGIEKMYINYKIIVGFDIFTRVSMKSPSSDS